MLKSYSYSSLNTFKSCPQQFKFNYLDKAPKSQKVSAVAYLGNAVHRVLEKLYKLGADGILMPLDDAVAQYNEEWNKLDRDIISVDSDYHTVDDYIRLGNEMLIKYYNKHEPFNHGVLLGSEIPIRFVLPGTNYTFNCRIDRLMKFDDGRVEICDYKTGAHLVRPKDPRYHLQMGLYQLAVKDYYRDFENIELNQYYLRMEEAVTYRMPEDELELLVEECKQAVLETIDAEKMNTFPAAEGIHCQWCDFYDICPAKRHKKMLEAEEVTSPEETNSPENLKKLADDYIRTNLEFNEMKSKLDVLKLTLADVARENDLSVLEGDGGQVRIKLSTSEKFITKTADAKALLELTILSRELQLDDYFILDGNALMKEIYKKRRLPEEDLKKLENYIITKDANRITVKLKHEDKNDKKIV